MAAGSLTLPKRFVVVVSLDTRATALNMDVNF